MTTAQNKMNGAQKQKPAPAEWPEQSRLGFHKVQAHEFAKDAFKLKARRRHDGPPAGMEERRKIMYSGRVDHLRLAEIHERQAKNAERQAKKQAEKKQAEQVKPAEPAPAVAPAVASLPAGLNLASLPAGAGLADALAAVLLQALAGLAPHLAHLANAHQAEQARTVDQARTIDQAEPAAPAVAHQAEQAEPAPAKRTRRAKKPAEQAAPAAHSAEHGRRALEQPTPMDEKERKALIRHYALLDVFLNSEEMDDLNPAKIDFGTHTQAYINAFMLCVHKGMNARRAHNFAPHSFKPLLKQSKKSLM
jgi:hypothetical protein